jgi:hypothetical protein
MARCVGFFPTLFQHPFFAIKLGLLLVNDEAERCHLIFPRIRAERYFAHIDASCMPNLGLRDDSTTGGSAIAASVDSAFACIVVRRHHAMLACGRSRVIFDLAACEGVDVIITDVRACVDEHVRVGIGVDDVPTASEGRIIRTRATGFFDLPLVSG